MGAGDDGAFVPGPRRRVAPTGSGALDGLSFAVKDLIDLAGLVTGGGNPDWRRTHGPAVRTAPAVARLLAAGAGVIGSTVSDELAFSLEGANIHDGTPLNPACPDRLPGGSSSGSAAAVAARLCDFALGTDTGGSVRIPASFCGLYGFRPSHGRIPLDGVIPFAPSYDTIGWFARDAGTLAAVGQVMLGGAAPGAAPPARFLLARDAFALAEPRVAQQLLPAAARFHSVDSIDVFDGEQAEILEAYRVLQGAEIWQSLGRWIEAVKPRFAPAIAERFAGAAAITAGQVAICAPVRRRFAERLRALLPAGSALLLPTSPSVALQKDAGGDVLGEFYRTALTLTSIAGHAGLPQLSLPLASLGGCPLGLSIIGRRDDDLRLLALGCAHAQRLQ